MTIDEIKELIQVVKETGIAELLVQRGQDSVKIVGTAPPLSSQVLPLSTMVPVVSAAAPVASMMPVPPAHVPPSTSFHTSETSVAEEDILVKSPIVGTYYDAPSPDAPKFVKIGDRVEPKHVLCIIESMKLMNEIEAETAGTIISKYIENGRPVEYGEALFSIRPAK